MEIKQATSYYLVDVLFLLKECVVEMNSMGLKQWNSAYPGPEIMRQDIENGTLYVFFEKGIAQGMINLCDQQPVEYKDITWKGSNDKVLYLNRFAVNPIWRDSNIPEELISFAENMAKEKGYLGIRLDVLDSYPVSKEFFTGKQFVEAGEFHSDFQKIPYVCYEKSL